MRAAQPDPTKRSRSAGTQRCAASGLAAGPVVSSWRLVVTRGYYQTPAGLEFLPACRSAGTSYPRFNPSVTSQKSLFLTVTPVNIDEHGVRVPHISDTTRASDHSMSRVGA